VSPLVTFSVGWSAASMDRLFVLFILLGVTLFFKKVNSNALCNDFSFFFCIFFLTLLAILSKETALIIPALILSAIYIPFDNTKNKRKGIILLTGAFLVAISLYFFLRFETFKNTFFGHYDTGSYDISVNNIFNNVIAYWSYPFLPFLNEVGSIVLLDHLFIFLASVFHVILLLFISIRLGSKVAVYYLFFFFLPLAPVLLIGGMGSQYLYASAISMSVALAVLVNSMLNTKGKNYASVFFVMVVFIILTIHSFSNQIFIYTIGRCTDKAVSSIDSQFRTLDRGDVYIEIERGAAKHILQRIITGREVAIFGEGTERKVIYLNSGENHPSANYFRFSSSCIFYSGK